MPSPIALDSPDRTESSSEPATAPPMPVIGAVMIGRQASGSRGPQEATTHHLPAVNGLKVPTSPTATSVTDWSQTPPLGATNVQSPPVQASCTTVAIYRGAPLTWLASVSTANSTVVSL